MESAFAVVMYLVVTVLRCWSFVAESFAAGLFVAGFAPERAEPGAASENPVAEMSAIEELVVEVVEVELLVTVMLLLGWVQTESEVFVVLVVEAAHMRIELEAPRFEIFVVVAD